MPGKRCSNCITYNLDCTYVEAAKVWYHCSLLSKQPPDVLFHQKRGPPKGYAIFFPFSHQAFMSIAPTVM